MLYQHVGICSDNNALKYVYIKQKPEECRQVRLAFICKHAINWISFHWIYQLFYQEYYQLWHFENLGRAQTRDNKCLSIRKISKAAHLLKRGGGGGCLQSGQQINFFFKLYLYFILMDTFPNTKWIWSDYDSSWPEVYWLRLGISKI